MSESTTIWILVIFAVLIIAALIIVFIPGKSGDANVSGELNLLDRIRVKISGTRSRVESEKKMVDDHATPGNSHSATASLSQVESADDLSIDEIIGAETNSDLESDGRVELNGVKAKNIKIGKIVGLRSKKDQ